MAQIFTSTPAPRETTSATAPVRYARDIRLALPVPARRRLHAWLRAREIARGARPTEIVMFI